MPEIFGNHEFERERSKFTTKRSTRCNIIGEQIKNAAK